MRSIGIDLGEYSVKVVELIQNKKSISINQVQEKVLNLNGSDQDRELEAIEFIRSLVSSQDFSNTRFVMSVRQDKVTSRFKTFPFADRLKIQKSLSFEMEEDIPFDSDSCIFESKLIRNIGTGAEILANAVPKKHVEKVLALATDFGIDLSLLTIEGLAFANLVESWSEPAPTQPADFSLEDIEKPRRTVQIVLNIGHKKTLFSAYDSNRLIFTRSLYWGADQLIQDIVRRYQVPALEAVRTLQSEGQLLLTKQNATFEQVQMSDLISKSLRELVRDLQMTSLELQSEFNADVSEIYLTGGGSLIQNLGGFLTQHLEIPCNPVLLLQDYSASLGALGLSEPLQSLDARFNEAVSLALESFKKPKNPAANLLKGEFAKQNDYVKNLWEQWGTLAQVLVAALVVLFFWSSVRESFSTTLAERGDDALKTQARQVARLPKTQANEKGVRKFIADNKKKANELKLVAQVAQMNSALDILKRVSETAPGREQLKIDIMNFSVKDDTVQITGYANTRLEVTTLEKNLKNIARGEVQSLTPNLTPVPNRQTFSLSFKTDRGLVK